MASGWSLMAISVLVYRWNLHFFHTLINFISFFTRQKYKPVQIEISNGFIDAGVQYTASEADQNVGGQTLYDKGRGLPTVLTYTNPRRGHVNSWPSYDFALGGFVEFLMGSCTHAGCLCSSNDISTVTWRFYGT